MHLLGKVLSPCHARCSAKAAVANADGRATLSIVPPDAGGAGDPGSIRCQSGGDGPGPAGMIPRNSSVVVSRTPSSALPHSVQRRCGIAEPRALKAGLGKGRRRPTAAMARRFQGAAAPCPK